MMNKLSKKKLKEGAGAEHAITCLFAGIGALALLPILLVLVIAGIAYAGAG